MGLTQGPVAFQGERGAFSEEAIVAHFGGVPKTLPCPTFEDAFESVRSGLAVSAVLPVENSVEGTVAPVNDLLLEHDLVVTGEVIIPVHHCLIARPGASSEGIAKVYSHPQALAQCRKFLAQYPGWKRIPAYDTAGAVKMIAEMGKGDEAAIAGRGAALIYGMAVLREAIEDEHQNYTRFFILEKDPEPVEDADKTSIAFAVKNVPGSVHQCLGEFARRGINLTKLESRPRRNRPWSYVFFADLEGSLEEARVKDAMGGLLRLAGSVRILGSYRAARRPDLKAGC